MADRAIEVWRRIIRNDKTWILFKQGTCVILSEPAADPADQARTLLREWGPVHAGCSAGDFSTLELKEGDGWVVTSHHDDILTYVGPDEIKQENVFDVEIGLLGRSKRGQDAEEPDVIHVEDKRLAV